MPKTKYTPGIHLYKTIVKRKVGAKFQYRSEFYWNLIAPNGKEITRSSETYTRKVNAKKSILVAAAIFLGGKPYELIEYYDHSEKDSPLKSYL